MVVEHIEPDIKFSFKKDSVIKYDDTHMHGECKHTSKKGVDFIYKYGAKLMFIEVKDFDRNLTGKTEFQQNQILKATYKTLELNSSNPFEGFVNKIIQKVNDTLLDVFSSSISKNKQELKKLSSKIKELIFIVVIDLPQDMKEYLNAISDKLTQYFKKYSCIFDTNVLVIDSTSKLSSFVMQKI